ncbi:MAG: hypothetical protein ACOYJB_05085 [Christensenellaceae bacterium]
MWAFPARCAGKRTVSPGEGYGHSGCGAQGGNRGAVALHLTPPARIPGAGAMEFA